MMDALVFLLFSRACWRGAISSTSRITVNPKDQETIEISDNEDALDYDVVVIEDDANSVDEGNNRVEEDISYQQ